MSIEAMKQALDALEFDGFTPEDATHRGYCEKATTALRQAIEQAEQEPVAYIETITGRVVDPGDEHRCRWPMCYEPLFRIKRAHDIKEK